MARIMTTFNGILESKRASSIKVFLSLKSEVSAVSEAFSLSKFLVDQHSPVKIIFTLCVRYLANKKLFLIICFGDLTWTPAQSVEMSGVSGCCGS